MSEVGEPGPLQTAAADRSTAARVCVQLAAQPEVLSTVSGPMDGRVKPAR